MKNLKIKKIPLKEFIESLIELYNAGTNYIDLSSEKFEDMDVIKIEVREEYVEKPSTDITEENLNNLIA